MKVRTGNLNPYAPENSPLSLTISTEAFYKLQWLAQYKPDLEGSVMGLTSANNIWRIEKVVMAPQEVSHAFVEFTDDGMSIHAERCLEKDMQMFQCMRHWIHWHPKGMSPQPSGTDLQTMQDSFGDCNWSVMTIMGRDGTFFSRCYINTTQGPDNLAGFKTHIDAKVFVEFPDPSVQMSDLWTPDLWRKEYEENVVEPKPMFSMFQPRSILGTPDYSGFGKHIEDDWTLEWGQKAVRDFQKKVKEEPDAGVLPDLPEDVEASEASDALPWASEIDSPLKYIAERVYGTDVCETLHYLENLLVGWGQDETDAEWLELEQSMEHEVEDAAEFMFDLRCEIMEIPDISPDFREVLKDLYV